MIRSTDDEPTLQIDLLSVLESLDLRHLCLMWSHNAHAIFNVFILRRGRGSFNFHCPGLVLVWFYIVWVVFIQVRWVMHILLTFWSNCEWIRIDYWPSPHLFVSVNITDNYKHRHTDAHTHCDGSQWTLDDNEDNNIIWNERKKKINEWNWYWW